MTDASLMMPQASLLLEERDEQAQLYRNKDIASLIHCGKVTTLAETRTMEA